MPAIFTLHVASQRQPAERVGRIAATGLELGKREPRVEEKAELFHAHLEELGEKEMAAFVQEYQDGKAEDEL